MAQKKRTTAGNLLRNAADQTFINEHQDMFLFQGHTSDGNPSIFFRLDSPHREHA